jgi:VCBS repeat-containing protein
VTRDVTFTYTAIDSDGAPSAEQTITITVTGRNDLPVIGGVTSATIVEDVDVTGSTIGASGKLTISDADAGHASFIAATINGTHGVLTIDTNGNWSYRADNNTSDIQSLRFGETLVETLTVTTFDGTNHDIEVRIDGSEESEPPTTISTEDPDPVPEETSLESELSEPPEAAIIDEVISALEEFDEEEIYTDPQIRDPLLVADRDPDGVIQYTDSQPSESTYIKTFVAEKSPVAAQEPTNQAINIDSLRFESSDDEAFNGRLEMALLERIEQMSMGIDGDASGRNIDGVEVKIFVGATTSLTAGIVSWVLRGGSLLASLMSTVPLLNRFDPLPILKSRSDEEDVEPDDDTEITGPVGEQHKRIDDMFDDNTVDPERSRFDDE